MRALGLINLRHWARYGSMDQPFRFQEKMSVRLFDVTVDVRHAAAGQRGNVSQVGGDRRLPCPALAAGHCNSHDLFLLPGSRHRPRPTNEEERKDNVTPVW